MISFTTVARRIWLKRRDQHRSQQSYYRRREQLSPTDAAAGGSNRLIATTLELPAVLVFGPQRLPDDPADAAMADYSNSS